MLRWPVVSAAVAMAMVVALAASASGSARPGPGPARASSAGRAGSAGASAQALTWSLVPSPNRGSGNNVLDGVSCVAAAACTAVGFTDTTSGTQKTLVESGTVSG